MKVVIDDKIPYIKEAIEKIADDHDTSRADGGKDAQQLRFYRLSQHDHGR